MLHRQRGRLGGQRRNLVRDQRAGFGQRNHAQKFYALPGKNAILETWRLGLPDRMNELIDPNGRRVDYLRISVTDRCNERCLYCLPENYSDWLPRADILTDDCGASAEASLPERLTHERNRFGRGLLVFGSPEASR